MEYYKKEK